MDNVNKKKQLTNLFVIKSMFWTFGFFTYMCSTAEQEVLVLIAPLGKLARLVLKQQQIFSSE